MYVATCTKPDISFTVSYLSQFETYYHSIHWTAAKRVLRYLKGSLKLELKYNRTGKPIRGFVDADWTNWPIDRRSYTGYTFILGRASVVWEFRKQLTVVLSLLEAEYMPLIEAAKQAIYILRFLKELDYYKCRDKTIYCDNNGARRIAENSVLHGRTKHIDVRRHYPREIKSRRYKDRIHCYRWHARRHSDERTPSAETLKMSNATRNNRQLRDQPILMSRGSIENKFFTIHWRTSWTSPHLWNLAFWTRVRQRTLFYYLTIGCPCNESCSLIIITFL